MRSDFYGLPWAAQQAIRRGEAAERRARRLSRDADDAAAEERKMVVEWLRRSATDPARYPIPGITNANWSIVLRAVCGAIERGEHKESVA